MAGLLAQNVFVVNPSVLGANNLCRAVLGFQNLMTTESVFTSSPNANYPFPLAYDYKTNTEYSPAESSGTVTIDIYNSTYLPCNYLGIFSKNAGDCNLSVTVSVLDQLTGLYVEVGSRSGFANAKPQMIYWDEKLTAAIRVVISFDSTCYIASLSVGKAVVFSRPPSVGYQPGRNASLDEVSNFSTDGNNFIQGRRLRNGFEEKAPINYQEYDWADTWWSDFMNHVLDSKPVFFMANNQRQNNCVFGLQNPQTLTKPKYKNSHHTDIELEIRGWA